MISNSMSPRSQNGEMNTEEKHPYQTSAAPRPREHAARRSPEGVRTGGWGEMLGNAVFSTRYGSSTYEITEAVTTCTRPRKDQASLLVTGETKEAPPIAEGLLQIMVAEGWGVIVLGDVNSSKLSFIKETTSLPPRSCEQATLIKGCRPPRKT